MLLPFFPKIARNSFIKLTEDFRRTLDVFKRMLNNIYACSAVVLLLMASCGLSVEYIERNIVCVLVDDESHQNLIL